MMVSRSPTLGASAETSLREVAAILVQGILRLQARARGCTSDRSCPNNGLDFTAKQSVHQTFSDEVERTA